MSSIPSISGGSFFSRPSAHASALPDPSTKIANELRLDDLKQDLTKWCNDCDIDESEKKIREYAAAKIKSDHIEEGRQSLYLAGLHITRLLNLSPLATLNSINFQNNHLTSFDGQNLPALRHLNLLGNKLTLFNGKDLPMLMSLNLDTNSFTSFEQIILPPMPNALKWIHLKNNPFKKIEELKITMTVRSRVIQDFSENDLALYGVKILPRPEDAYFPDLSKNKAAIRKWLDEVDGSQIYSFHSKDTQENRI